MKKLIIASMLLIAPAFGFASGGGGVALESADINLADRASLQRGAQVFVNHCMGCHSLQYMRWNRLAADTGLTDAQVMENFVFTDANVGSQMITSMRPEEAEKWFGTAVPDLTLVTRWRSPDWVYSYLKSFYADPARPYGVNNTVFPDVGMPHVLQPLQGVQKAVYQEHKDAAGHTTKVFDHFEAASKGSLAPAEYDRMVRDLTAFLTYAGEPMQLERQRLGVYVLLFLAVFFVLAYALKKEYWKDVH
jgi:ubiquinol-cytochrome c reductase cytochrome c1 subunit